MTTATIPTTEIDPQLLLLDVSNTTLTDSYFLLPPVLSAEVQKRA
jgi:hypothetical protein